MGSHAPSFKEAATLAPSPQHRLERERQARAPCTVRLLSRGKQVLNVYSGHQPPSAPGEAARSLLLTFSGQVLTNTYVLQEGYC